MKCIGIVFILLLFASCKGQNGAGGMFSGQGLSQSDQALLSQGDITGFVGGSLTGPGGNGNCLTSTNPGSSYGSNKKACSEKDRAILKNLMEAKLKGGVKAGGNKGNVSAYMSEIDDKGQPIGEPILDKNSNQFEAVASSQKILTAYYLYKNRSKIQYPTTMGNNARKVVYSSSGKIMESSNDYWNRNKTGSLSERELFVGILHASSNGASFRAMELVTGSTSEKVHASKLNALAKSLLSEDAKTNFSNAHGLDSYNYGGRGGNQKEGVHGSTPKEMAMMQAKILSDPGYQNFLKKTLGHVVPGKVGITKRAGYNNVMVQVKKSGPCKGRRFAIYYGGGKGTSKFNGDFLNNI